MENTRNRKILMAVTLFFWYAQYVYVPYQTPYLTALGVSAAAVGVILGAYGFSQMVIRIPLGMASDRKPRHKMMIAMGAACAGVASLLRVASASEEAFLAANLISGFASATYISFTVLNATYYREDELQKAMGHITAMNNAGVLAGFVSGMIVAETVGVEPLFIMSAVSGAVGFLLSLFIKQNKKPFPMVPVKKLLSALKSRTLIIFSVIALVLQMVHMSTAMSFTTQVAKDMGASNIEIGLCSVVYMALSITSSYFVGTAAAKKIGGRLIMAVSFVCVTLYCLLVPLSGSMLQLYILQAVCGFSYGAVFSICMSAAVKGVPPEKKSTAMGFFQAVYGIGMTVGPMIFGAVKDASGSQSGFYFLAIFAAVGIAASLIAYSNKFTKKEGLL